MAKTFSNFHTEIYQKMVVLFWSRFWCSPRRWYVMFVTLIWHPLWSDWKIELKTSQAKKVFFLISGPTTGKCYKWNRLLLFSRQNRKSGSFCWSIVAIEILMQISVRFAFCSSVLLNNNCILLKKCLQLCNAWRHCWVLYAVWMIHIEC